MSRIRHSLMKYKCMDPWTGLELVGVKAIPLCVHGLVEVLMHIAEEPFRLTVVVVDGLTTETILGLDFLEIHDI